MEKQRDFNGVAKFLLALSMFSVAMAIINNVIRISALSSFPGGNRETMLIEVIFNCLILIAAIFTFLKKKYGLIALTVLFLLRMFASLPFANDAAYALGGNMVYFIRDFGIFAIAMCFKKDGVSGWKSMLSNQNDENIELTEQDAPEQENIEESVVEPMPTIEENAEPVVAKESIIVEEVSVSELEVEESKGLTTKSIKEKFKPINLTKIIWIIVGSLFVLSIVAGCLYVNFSWYPYDFDKFGDKLKYTLNLPNNHLAKQYFEQYQKAKEIGLDDAAKEHLTAAFAVHPDDLALLDSISQASFKNDLKTICIAACEDILKVNPKNLDAQKRLIKQYYNTDDMDNAYKWVASVLMESPNDDLCIDAMCRKACNDEDWSNLTKWGKKGYDLGYENTSYGVELAYYYAKGLYELGNIAEAKQIYYEAECKDVDNENLWLHNKLTKIGGLPCSILSLSVENRRYDDTLVSKTYIYDNNAYYLTPVVRIKPLRKGNFNFDIKLYENGILCSGSNSKDGYTYDANIKINSSLSEQTISLSGWGRDKPDGWEDGGYRFEIWWEGECLFTKSFNIYSGFWHDLGYSNRFD